jgi:hypothetical protein
MGFAQSGSLSGRLTGLYSKPLAGVSVVARNQATGAEARATTTKNGSYRFEALEPGEYALVVESPQLGRGHLEDILVSAGYEARVQAAMQFEPLPSGPTLAATREPKRPELRRTNLELIPLALSEVTLPAEPLRMLSLRAQALTGAGEKPADMVSKAAVSTGAASPKTPVPAGRQTPNSVQIAAKNQGQEICILHSHLGDKNKDVARVGHPDTARVGHPDTARVGHPDTARMGPPDSVAIQKGCLNQVATSAPTSAAFQRPKTGAKASMQSGPAPAAAADTMSAAELQALPVSGRRWQDFVLDNAPASATSAGGEAETTLLGAGPQQPGIAVDGVSKALAFGPTGGAGHGSTGPGPLGQGGADPAGMARIGVGGHGLTVSEAAIREVQSAAGNVEAAAARAAGGRMNVKTQHGSNELHGHGFLFNRQNLWGAQNPYSKWTKETEAASALYNSVPRFTEQPYTPPDRDTTWGIGLGSRIRRDKLFWFAAVDGSDRNDPGVSMVKHPCLGYDANGVCTSGFFANPTSAEMQMLAARLGLSGSNAEAEGRAKYSCMLETLAGTLGGASSDCLLGTPLSPLLGPAPRTATQWSGFGRLDWKVAERHSLTLEGSGARWNSPGGGLSRVTENYSNHSFGSTKASEEWLLGRWEAFVTPNLLAVTQVSFGHTLRQAGPEAPSAYEKTFLNGNVGLSGILNQLPQIVVDSSYGFTIGNPSRFGQGNYPDERLDKAQESVDWVRGSLLVKVGFDANHNADATSLVRNQTGTYTYSKVGNFISDTLVFQKYGLTDALDPYNSHQHNCDETGKVWRDTDGTLYGRGNLPCYSYFSQTIGPANWRVNTNDWAGYATAQWQANKLMVVSAGLRWEREQLPPPLALVRNSELPLTEKLPSLGNQWGPRVSLAVGNGASHWPLLRLGYGMYFGRVTNLTLQTALSQTGSLKGDLSFFMRPTDDNPNNGNGTPAPPFPYVPRPPGPEGAIMPGAVEFAPQFRNPEIHQAVAAVEETLPGHVEVSASAIMSLGRRLPVSIDTNLDVPASTQFITYDVCDQTLSKTGDATCGHTGLGPIKAATIKVPFYASWPTSEKICESVSTSFSGRPNPCYQQITSIESRANSTYEAMMLKFVRQSRGGLSLRAHYTYSHAMDWNPNESSQAAGNDVLEPDNFKIEYGTSNLDRRHSAAAWAIYEAPWKLQGLAGKLGNGWMVSGTGQFHSGMPYTMHTSGSLAKELNADGTAIVALGPGMNGSGGDNRIYGTDSNGNIYNIGRNTYRYPSTWKVDLRLGRRFGFGNMRQLEVLAESFNLFNHQNVTEVETIGYHIESGSASSQPTLNFLTGLKANTTAFGQPLNVNATNFYRERKIEFGLRMKF